MTIRDKLDQFKKQMREEMIETINQRLTANTSDADEDHEKTALRRDNERLQREVERLQREIRILSSEINRLKTEQNSRFGKLTNTNKRLRGKLAKFNEMISEDVRASDDDDESSDDVVAGAAMTSDSRHTAAKRRQQQQSTRGHKVRVLIVNLLYCFISQNDLTHWYIQIN